jgi:hypothetical protein
VLGLQQQLCLARAAARQGHEGGVEGKAAARVVNQMAGQLKKAGGAKEAGGLPPLLLLLVYASAQPYR